MPTTSGMKRGGYYNAHSNEQRAALDAFLPWIEDALEDLPLPPIGSPPIGLLDAVEDDLLPRKIYQDLIFPVYFRTLAELTAPIESGADLAACFRIEKTGDRDVPAPSIWSARKPATSRYGPAAMRAFCAPLPNRFSLPPFRQRSPNPGLYRISTGGLSKDLWPTPTAMNFIISPWGHC